ncbi:MAG TPA: cell division protein FtsL [Clostridiaceae bacterium]|jgi:cell division protein FtsL|nr:cell division protein FtsL [Clostridiaceae bacterium]
MDRKNSYVYGSAAPSMPQRAKQPLEQQRVERKPSIRPIPQKSDIPKAKLIFAVLFVASVCFGILYRFCVITEMNTRMGALTEQYNQLRNENRMLNVEIETGIDLNKVKEIAETKLDMHTPDSYQIVLVNVPKSNYSVVLDHEYIDNSVQNSSLMEKIINTAKAVLP